MIEFYPGLFRGPRLDTIPPEIKTVIDLQYSSRDILNEARVPNFYWMGTIAIFPPDKNRVKATLNLLQREELRPLYLHCESGVDRTGYMVAKFRVEVQRWHKGEAGQEMIRMGMHPWLFWWGLFL